MMSLIITADWFKLQSRKTKNKLFNTNHKTPNGKAVVLGDLSFSIIFQCKVIALKYRAYLLLKKYRLKKMMIRDCTVYFVAMLMLTNVTSIKSISANQCFVGETRRN